MNESTLLLLNSQHRRTSPKYFIIGTLIVAVIFWFQMRDGMHQQPPPHRQGPQKVRVYTNNIRYDNRGRRDAGEEPWETRSVQVINSIDFNTGLGPANVVCLQEVLHSQLQDILTGLNVNSHGDEWTYYGVGRTDGKQQGEYAPILYKASQWRLVENRTFWLSETPDVPSRGWDAALERLVTMVTIEARNDPLITINVFNTHFDHRGQKARQESALLIVDKMNNYNDWPSFLCGDFNTEPTDEPYAVLKRAGYKDSRALIDPRFSYGSNSTFSGFDRSGEVNTIIDYIWTPHFTVPSQFGGAIASNHRFAIVLRHFGILENFYRGYHFLDHRPVVADYDVLTARKS